MEKVEAGATEVGRSIDRSTFYAATLSTVVVLEPGERPDSDRVKKFCAAFVVASLHYAYDQWRNYGREPTNPAILEIWGDYRALLEQVPEAVRHQRIHQGHNCWVVPEEEQLITSDLMQATCLIGEPDALVDRLQALGAAGLDHLMILPPHDVRYEVLESVGRELIPRLKDAGTI